MNGVFQTTLWGRRLHFLFKFFQAPLYGFKYCLFHGGRT